MVCDNTCKWICIIAYVLASLGSIVYYSKQVAKRSFEVPNSVITLYAIGGLVTLGCAIKWALVKQAKSI